MFSQELIYVVVAAAELVLNMLLAISGPHERISYIRSSTSGGCPESNVNKPLFYGAGSRLRCAGAGNSLGPLIHFQTPYSPVRLRIVSGVRTHVV
jgi:hypothetical protein